MTALLNFIRWLFGRPIRPKARRRPDLRVAGPLRCSAPGCPECNTWEVSR